MASSFWCRDSYNGTYIGLPQAARQVPRSTLLHTVYSKRISYPLTSRPSELWIIEVDQAGNESWRTAEDFIYRFCPPTEDTTIQYWANSWREYNDIPPLSSTQTSQSQFPVLPQPQHSRATAGRPATWIPDHSHILQSCWGRSAHRFSQGDPSPSLLQPVTANFPSTTSTLRSNQPEPEPTAQMPPPSSLTTSGTSSHFMEIIPSDDNL